jgi:hypothetical protein
MKAVDAGGGAGSFDAQLDNAVAEFQAAYEAANEKYVKEREVQKARVDAAPGGVVYASGGGQVIAPVTTSWWGEPVLAPYVEAFRGLPEPKAATSLTHMVERSWSHLPYQLPEALLDTVDGHRGPASEAYKWHFYALRWSLAKQFDILRALSGISAAYAELNRRTRTYSLRIINAGTEALREAAEGGEGGVSIGIDDVGSFLFDVAVNTVGKLLTHDPRRAMLEGIVDTVIDRLKDAAIEFFSEDEVVGTAENILSQTVNSLTRLKSAAEQRRDVLLECVADVEKAISDPGTFGGRSQRPDWTDLKLPLPGSPVGCR